MELVKELGVTQTTSGKRKTAVFKCEFCNKEYTLRRDRGLVQVSCKECRNTLRKTHGMAGTKPYHIWQQMIQRCENPMNQKFHLYGEKGISISNEWKTFEGFWNDMSKLYTDGMSIHRKNGDLGYNSSNAIWVPRSRNSSETSKRRPIRQMSKRYEPIKDWESAKYAADELNLVPSHITSVCKGLRQTHGGFRWEYKT